MIAKLNKIDDLFSHMHDAEYDKVLTVIKLSLVLSHEHASVESVFSVNKYVEVGSKQGGKDQESIQSSTTPNT